MKEKNIYNIIDLYFEARLSCAEEEELFRSLLSFKGDDSKVKEALAVMLLTRVDSKSNVSRESCKRSKPVIHPNISSLLRAAAVVIAVICVTVLWHYTGYEAGNGNEAMMAYVGGVRVSDHSEIMKIVDDQLNDIGMSSELFAQTVSDDLEDIRDALNEESL